MRWMVEARNKIEKEGDLDSQSYVRAEIVASYLDDGPSVEVPARLFQSPAELLGSISPDMLFAHILKHGSLRIERKWIENTLPEYELLEALAIAYGRVAEVVYSAHQQTGLIVPEFRHSDGDPRLDLSTMGWRMPCMIDHGTARSIMISLADAKSVSMTRRLVPVSEEGGAKAEKRYGTAILSEMKESKADTLEDIARAFFKMAKTIFLRDKHHQSMVMLLKEHKPIRIMATPASSQLDKYLIMREVANEVVRYGADAIFLIGEVWIASAEKLRPYERPGESKDRREALVLLLASRDGAPRRLSAIIRRKGLLGRKVSLDQTEEMGEGAAFVLAPIYKAWGKDIPQEWVSAEEKIMAMALRP